MEERYFSDDAEFEEIEIAEEELIDRYVRGELSGSDIDRLKKTIATSPRLMNRVEFAKLFANKLATTEASLIDPAPAREPHSKTTSWWSKLFGVPAESRNLRVATAFSILLLLVGGAALLLGWLRLREETKRLMAQQAALEQRQQELDKRAADLKTQTEELAKRSQQPPLQTPSPVEVAQQPTPQNANRVVYLSLFPGSTRSASGSKPIRLGPGTSEVQLTLNLRSTDYPVYRVIVFNADRAQVFSQPGLKARATKIGSVLSFRVSANRLPVGDYYVSVFDGAAGPSGSSVEDYVFHIIR
jgi:anti-sigma factor RsiW